MNIDLGPTFISLAGQQVPSYMDGKSLVPLLTAGQERRAESFRSRLLVEHYGEHGFAIAGCPQYQGQGMAVSTASSLSFLLHSDVSSVQPRNSCKYSFFSLFSSTVMFPQYSQGTAVSTASLFSPSR